MLSQLPLSQLGATHFPAIPGPQAALQLAIQYQLESIQWWPQQQLQQHQYHQLGLLLAHANATVPYYQEIFKQSNLQLPALVTSDFWQRIPISGRQAVQHAGLKLVSQRIPPEHGPTEFGTTSGSTGRPVRFARTGLTHSLWLAFAMRDHLWHTRHFKGKLAAIRWYPKGTADFPGGETSDNWGPIVAPLFASGPSAVLNVTARLSHQLAWLQQQQPDYLVSFPSNLMALAQHALDQGQSLPNLLELRTVGETLSDEARQRLTDAFKAPVVDIYTCEEAGYLALQCPQTGNYHVQSENVLLEIVDDKGQPCAAGQPGQVLITTLHNYATPLIRYELGDIAEFGDPCACGRGLPVVRRILGRNRNRLHLPNGNTVFPYLGEHGGIGRATGVKLHQFQCVQHSVNDIELKLVMDRPLASDETSKIVSLMQNNLGHPFPIRCTLLKDIPRNANGKFEEFVSWVT